MENNKKEKEIIDGTGLFTVIATVLSFFFIITALCCWDYNPGNWPIIARIIWVVVSMVVSAKQLSKYDFKK